MSAEPFLAIADDAGSAPLLAETRALFDAVNALDLERLRALVDDDCGIVDIDPAGGSVVIDSPGEWEDYMRRNMESLAAAGGRLSTEILDYHGTRAETLAYSMVRFRQRVSVGEETSSHHCIATIVWKWAGGSWREARWHCSLVPPPQASGR